MKILIIGASGLVGSHIFKEAKRNCHEVIGTYRNCQVPGLVSLDLVDIDKVEALINSFAPDWIVHSAGWTWVDGCEKNPKSAREQNTLQPLMLARLCKTRRIRMVYISTSYVFDGKAGPYNEADVPNPINIYGKTKYEAECLVQEELSGLALIPRVICVWGREIQAKNFVYQVMRSLQSGSSMRLPCDQKGNPTWAGDIAKWCCLLMAEGASGFWHLGSEDTDCNRLQWYNSIEIGFRALALPGLTAVVPVPVPTYEFKQDAMRPLNASILCQKIQARFPLATRRPDQLSVLTRE
jgi:dTDP-4-dehydrorhamnose reductase